MKEIKKWEIIGTEYLIRRPWLTARRDHVRLPSGVENKEYYILEYPEWVNVIAITKDGKFLMERQYRHGIQDVRFEICAGVCETGEDPMIAAKRELLEETGYAGGEWRHFMSVCANAGSMTNWSHTVLAEGVETALQKEFLKDAHCDMIQGYFYAKPMPEEQFTEYLEQHQCMALRGKKWKYNRYPRVTRTRSNRAVTARIAGSVRMKAGVVVSSA